MILYWTDFYGVGTMRASPILMDLLEEGSNNLAGWKYSTPKRGLWRVLAYLTRRRKCLRLNQIIFSLPKQEGYPLRESNPFLRHEKTMS